MISSVWKSLVVTGLMVGLVGAPTIALDALRELDLPVGPATRLLVLAPHPDDEALGAAGLMQRVIAAGGSVRVALITSGDAFPEGVMAAIHIRPPRPRDYRNYGNLRGRETIAAPRVLHYLIHYRQRPLDGGDPTSPLQPPAGFPTSEGEWRTLSLTPAEAAVKRRVLDMYASQMLVMPRFLQAFGRSNELFLEGRPASLPECWCDETNVATEILPELYRRRPKSRR